MPISLILLVTMHTVDERPMPASCIPLPPPSHHGWKMAPKKTIFKGFFLKNRKKPQK